MGQINLGVVCATDRQAVDPCREWSGSRAAGRCVRAGTPARVQHRLLSAWPRYPVVCNEWRPETVGGSGLEHRTGRRLPERASSGGRPGDPDTMQRDRARRYALVGLAGVLVLGLLLLLSYHTGLLPVTPGDYEQRTLAVTDCDGTDRDTLRVDVAESFDERYVGLSRTDSLAPGEGMLFTYGGESNRDIVMRNMDFGLDVVYVGSNGTITGIATLDAPDGPVESHLTYDSTSGVGQYILEANAGWSNEHGVSPGDCVTGLP